MGRPKREKVRTTHSAKSLFDDTIQAADQCLALYDGVSRLGTVHDPDWLLRACVVFSVSALDRFFHDKVRYRIGSLTLDTLPPALSKMTIPIKAVVDWDSATRKGNVIRNWVMNELDTRPILTIQDITEAMKLVEIRDFWQATCGNHAEVKKLLEQITKRRNQIAHEGDRERSRRSMKKLRVIDRNVVSGWIQFIKDLVGRIEERFPK